MMFEPLGDLMRGPCKSDWGFGQEYYGFQVIRQDQHYGGLRENSWNG